MWDTCQEASCAETGCLLGDALLAKGKWNRRGRVSLVGSGKHSTAGQHLIDVVPVQDPTYHSLPVLISDLPETHLQKSQRGKKKKKTERRYAQIPSVIRSSAPASFFWHILMG